MTGVHQGCARVRILMALADKEMTWPALRAATGVKSQSELTLLISRDDVQKVMDGKPRYRATDRGKTLQKEWGRELRAPWRLDI